MKEPIGVTILGATGSVGASTLAVLARYPERFRVTALTANTQADALLQLCVKWRPDVAVLANPAADSVTSKFVQRLRAAGCPTELRVGSQALRDVVELPQTQYVMAAIVGAAGLVPTLAAAQAGKRVLLANKEALVMAGPLFLDAVRNNSAEILPIDSEHNALFQCLPGALADRLAVADAGAGCGSDAGADIAQLWLTASGGPFLNTPAAELAEMTPAQACAHPNWSMGRKISVDSATLMNKGLELIEAGWLFACDPDRIEVVIHPQSIIHSLVEYADGSILAQLGQPDMRTPIAHALSWPEQRIDAGVSRLDLHTLKALEFQPPDEQRFPCLRLAKQTFAAAKRGSPGAPVVLNAANEEAVAAFLAGALCFTDIASVVEDTLTKTANDHSYSGDLDAVLTLDARARAVAQAAITTFSGIKQQSLSKGKGVAHG